MPPKCSVCTHKDVEQIDKAIQDSVSFRDIARQYDTLEKDAIWRHTNNCLKLDLHVLRQEKRIRRAINVYDEFDKNLAFVEALREAAVVYLRNPLHGPEDPLGITLIPHAHEIDIVYADWNELNERGKPTKKVGRLDALLKAIADSERGFEPSEFKIKTTDIRKYALEVVDRIDMTLDKFARMGGHYQKNRSNEADVSELIEAFAQRLIARGWDRQVALDHAKTKYQQQGMLTG